MEENLQNNFKFYKIFQISTLSSDAFLVIFVSLSLSTLRLFSEFLLVKSRLPQLLISRKKPNPRAIIKMLGTTFKLNYLFLIRFWII
ncbi:unnamed protein product [Meloidogyne enterolobii]|uniref:Uncharacterized protein n=1 Tax=Meloidogyne enterolobii TaxID=390850 RepID=A0ACB0ZPZ8_MELEN